MFVAVKLLIRGNQAYKYIVGLLVSFWLVDLITQRIKARKIAWGQLESWVTRSVLLSQSEISTQECQNGQNKIKTRRGVLFFQRIWICS